MIVFANAIGRFGIQQDNPSYTDAMADDDQIKIPAKLSGGLAPAATIMSGR